MTKKSVRQKAAGPLVRTNSKDALRRADNGTYRSLVGEIAELLETARQSSARAVNAIMTATYWEVGRRVVEYEQGGKARAEYGAALLMKLSVDLSRRCGRRLCVDNLQRSRLFYLAHSPKLIYATLSRKSPLGPPTDMDAREAPSLAELAACFPLPWSAYVRLLAVKDGNARCFYEAEALSGGWSVRQLDRQIQSQFYERTALSKAKTSMLAKGARRQAEDAVSADEEIKDPYVLEFLGLRDEYSETDMEQALIRHLESFLLELGGDFCFVGRQKRLRIGDEWFRVDLVFYHRRLRCLVLTDLKLGRFTHADAGQMHTYLNYATEHWTHAGENPPVGLILCAQRDEALAHYALGNLPSKVMAAEYRTVLPDEKLLAADLGRARRMLERRRTGK